MKLLAWIIILLLVAIAAGQAGWIVRDWITDDGRDRLTKLEKRVQDIHGEFMVDKGPVPKVPKKGVRGWPIPNPQTPIPEVENDPDLHGL